MKAEMPIYNFCPGPALLPEPVLEQIQAALKSGLNGFSPLSVSHRGPEFGPIIERSEANLRSLLHIPPDYHVLFVAGGASFHFGVAPLNLLPFQQSADYVVTGHWSLRAYQEAQRVGRVRLALDVSDSATYIPPVSTWELDPRAAYVHYTPNETVDGLQLHEIPALDAPLVADCSSEFLSKPIDISRFAMLYAGAQKNIGPAGFSIVIIHRDYVGKARTGTPSLMDYATYVASRSLANTPPTFSWYVVDLVLQWFQDEGGLAVIAARNQRKAALLYGIIDASGGFYRNDVFPAQRSWMNVVFFLPTPALHQAFLQGAAERGLRYLKGHAVKGGIRASIYNAMPESGVAALAEWMQTFQRQHA